MYALCIISLLLSLPQQANHNPITKSNNTQKPDSNSQNKQASSGDSGLSGNYQISEPQKKTHQQEDDDAFERSFQHWYWGATILGVGIALVTLIAFCFQTGATRIAANAAQRSAEAASKNAEAVIESQRAQLTVHIRTEVIKEVEAGNIPKVRFDVKNTGPTAAFHCTFETWCEILPGTVLKSPEAFAGFSNEAKYVAFKEPITLYSNAATPTIAHAWLGRKVTEEELDLLRRGKSVLAFRIRFEYIDAFKKARYQDFGFYAQSHGMSFLPKYNDSN